MKREAIFAVLLHRPSGAMPADADWPPTTRRGNAADIVSAVG
jgi:hypothetical protein